MVLGKAKGREAAEAWWKLRSCLGCEDVIITQFIQDKFSFLLSVSTEAKSQSPLHSILQVGIDLLK